MAERGADLAYGRTLPRLLRESDLTDVDAEDFFPIASRACAVLEAATVRHVRDQLLAAELATPEEIETHLANLAHGDLDLMLAPMITLGPQARLKLQTTGPSVLVRRDPRQTSTGRRCVTECTLSLEMFQASAYIRATVIDTNDHRAWSKSIWLN